MSMKHLMLVFAIAAFHASCAPKVKSKIVQTAEPLGESGTVVTLYPSESSPPNAILLGTFRVGEQGATVGCTYEVVMKLALQDARLHGANILHIQKIKEPNGGSTCFTFKGSYFKVPDIYSYQDSIVALEDSITATKFKGDKGYALLHVYRPSLGYGWALNYKLHQNDSVLCKIRNGFYETFRIDNPQCYNFWAKTESLEELNLCIEGGQEYYLKCGVSLGAFIGRPRIFLVEKSLGRSEFQEK